MTNPAAFSGFTKETVRFFNGLRRNNNREWFNRNRETYDKQVMEPAKAFVTAMGERLKAVVPKVIAVPLINKSIFRINRDTRFTLDPSPYKTHLGLYFWEGTKPKMESPGFYFHVEPPNRDQVGFITEEMADSAELCVCQSHGNVRYKKYVLEFPELSRTPDRKNENDDGDTQKDRQEG